MRAWLKVEAARSSSAGCDKSALDRLASAEAELEDALEAVLDAECADSGGFDSSGVSA